MQASTFEVPRELTLRVTQAEFAAIASVNHDLQLELTANGELIVNPPTGSEPSRQNMSITAQLWLWAESNPTLGLAFESSGGFELPNGAIRSPDASWVSRNRWDALSQGEKEDFAPLCPDFVVELRSKSDRLNTLQDKMQEYIDNGARLGWLIDAQNKKVEVYSQGKEVEVLDQPTQLSGEGVLPVFTLSLRNIW
ncbi:MAG: Uma2 family endonuclease [Cyanobacteria bacterium J06627_8]